MKESYSRLKKILIIFIFLLGKEQFIYGQNPKTVLSELHVTKSDTAKIRLLVLMSEICELNEISYYGNKAINLCDKLLKKTKNNNKLERFLLEKKAFALNNIGYQIHGYGNIPKALEYYKKSIEIQEKIGDLKGLANSLNNIGYTYQIEGNIKKALEYYHKSLAMQKAIKDKEGLGVSYNNIAIIYRNQGDIPKAIEYIHYSLKTQEEIKDMDGVARSLRNLGIIYRDQNNIPKALKYLFKSLYIRQKIHDKKGVASSYASLGDLYSKTNLQKSLFYFSKSLTINREIKELEGIATTLNSIGAIYLKTNQIERAQNSMKEALSIFKTLNAKQGMSTSYYQLAQSYFINKQLSLAQKYAELSLKMSQELGFPASIANYSKLLSSIYYQQGNYKKAFDMQNLTIQMSDSINNEKNKQLLIQRDYQYIYDKKSIKDSLKNIQERKIFNATINHEKNQRNYLYGGIMLIALFAGIMYNRMRLTKKQKQIIELQKEEVDKKHLIAEEQKFIIQTKQKEIVDSIHYASRIQQAMLTSEDYIQQHLPNDYFILYQPKDIVSGDFYWATFANQRFYIATADCTGHGVPGAFMSLLNISFLNENVIERKIKSPYLILNEQRHQITKALNPRGNENSKDGMDCVLCSFDFKNNNLEFSAAYNPVWLIRNGELIEYKGDKMPVGMHTDLENSFTHQFIELQKGDVIYTLTDGFADQFGGPNGKKFKYHQLKDLLISIQYLSLEEQKKHLLNTFNHWKNENEQVDDVLIIGIKV